MVADKRPPALGGNALPSTVVPVLRHVLPYGPRRHPQAQFEQQFIGNALLAPGRVVVSHLADERLEFRRDGGASRCGLPAPEEPEPLLMPAEQGRWLDND